ncbi:tyrosine-protein kinase-like otk [Aricia agestis]|uniref:tyrosine-protein kinase-like otk n=1 Tax=Aricia agestis TaxID=91739 RepID=UPI001C2022BE|nr:tyrosine-protein kinase-like otk [Aricia agestis]
MWKCVVFFLLFCDTQLCLGHNEAAHRGHGHTHKLRRHRAANDSALRFEPVPYGKKLELGGAGKIHCKVAGGVAPVVSWFRNESDPLPAGVTSANGTLLVAEATRDLAGAYTCRATDGDRSIESRVNVDIVVLPRVIEPSRGQQLHVAVGGRATLTCRATGDPPPVTHWDRGAAPLGADGADGENTNTTSSRITVLNNGSMLITNVSMSDGGQYGCTAGSAAGLHREELTLVVHPAGEALPEGGGVAGRAVLVSAAVAAAYMLLVLALMLYCRRRRLRRRARGEKEELEMCEGREKLVEGGEGGGEGQGGGVVSAADKKPAQNGRLVLHDKDSGPDNSEVSGVSRVSKRSGQYDQLSIPRSLLTEQIMLGRGEFGDVLLAKIDINQLRRLRGGAGGAGAPGAEGEVHMKPVLMKLLSTTDETHLAEFRRQLELFRAARHEHVARLFGLCTDREPHALMLEHTDWGDLKSFLLATRTPPDSMSGGDVTPAAPLAPAHRLLLAAQLAAAADRIAAKRLTHRDIAARNCCITSKLQLKLSLPALTRGPHQHEYHKLHDQVIPLRWLPAEAALEGEYSTKSDVYMYAATVWEIYTKAELPFVKLNDNSVLERLKAGTLEWTPPPDAPDRLVALLKRCWQTSPAERPQFSEVHEEVTALIAEETAAEKQEEKEE